MTHKLIMYVHLNYLIATCASVTHFIKKILYKGSTLYSVTKSTFAGTPTTILQIFTSVSKQNLAQILFLIYSTERNGAATV